MDISGFKPIDGFDGRYLIDRYGNILSKNTRPNQYHAKTEQLTPMRQNISKEGYRCISLRNSNRKRTNYLVHRLVALTFLDNPEGKSYVCHKDNNKLNCNVDNLYWGTNSENVIQAYDDGLNNLVCPVAKLDADGNVLDAYLSQNRAGKINNIKTSHINDCINGRKRKTTKGAKFG